MDTHRIGFDPAFAHLPDRLPQGRLLDRDSLPPRGGGAVMWLSDGAIADGGAWWGHLRRGHAESGLWPLLVGGPRAGPFRPWRTGDLTPSTVEAVDAADPAEVLARLWPLAIARGDGSAIPAHDRATIPAHDRATIPAHDRAGTPAHDRAGPLDRAAAPARGDGSATPSDAVPSAFPGLARRVFRGRSPDVVADECAVVLTVWRSPRLGLVAAARGADAPAVCGWPGAGRHTQDLPGLCAVLRSWEDRFGARIVGLGHDSLDVAVARPPTNPVGALAVAAEHFAFCPGNLHPLDGRPGGPDLKCYALDLIHRRRWHFWWD